MVVFRRRVNYYFAVLKSFFYALVAQDQFSCTNGQQTVLGCLGYGFWDGDSDATLNGGSCHLNNRFTISFFD